MVAFINLLCLLFCVHVEAQDAAPEQIHLSYGAEPSHMVVTWSTQKISNGTMCAYGLDSSLASTATGFSVKFSQSSSGSSVNHTQYIHRTTLVNLKPGVKYFYRCGDGVQMSPELYFFSKRTDTKWSPSIALFGDMGKTNAQSLIRLEKDVQKNMYDAIFHVGDFAYDMDSDNGQVGDSFMRNIQPIAAHVPYMTCPGNHEEKGNFSNYKNRFTMPTDELSERMFYSFDMGPIHVISFSTEYLFFLQFGFEQILNQYNWLKQDLEKANRTKTPWIMTMGHRPMYCSNNDRDDCTHEESLVRVGIPFIHAYSLEQLFKKYDVDLMFWAHEHSYERLWPVYDRTVFNGTKYPYTNPGAPVHITTGSAGCSEDHDNFGHANQWSAFRSTDYGYTRMKVFNATHIYIEQVSDDKDGMIIDKIWYIKECHGNIRFNEQGHSSYC
ncbi:acid phosphatase type 7-like [Pecten maximus]|uniref:acid phosphatase type 7-like n=1 Tax=Pecten maximus TaxID=6579 RepID=UPI0014589B02|nr:acid phosphatase type 7-like [Pecten maximus]